MGWAFLGVFLFLLFGDQWYWTVLAGVPWIMGAGLLRSQRLVHRLQTNGAPFTSQHTGALPAVLLGLAIAFTWLMGLAFVLLVSAYLGVVLLALVYLRGPAAAHALLAGVATSASTVLVVGLLVEAILDSSALRAIHGPPSERTAFAERYDHLGREGNLFGFRTPYEEVRKEAGTLRIVAIGDSYTWGDKIVDTEDTWPAHLEALLRDQRPDRVVEVVNLGGRGYTTANEVEVMTRIGWQLDPDLVVLQYLLNDVFPSQPGLRSLGYRAVFGHFRLLPVRFRQGAIRNSALLSFIEAQLNRILIEPDFSRLYEDGSVGWQQVQQAFSDVAADSAERNVPVLLVLVPMFSPGTWDQETHPHRELHREVLAAAARTQIDTLDLTSAFGRKGQDGTFWWATPWDSHPNENAHAIIAEEILEHLKVLEII